MTDIIDQMKELRAKAEQYDDLQKEFEDYKEKVGKAINDLSLLSSAKIESMSLGKKSVKLKPVAEMIYSEMKANKVKVNVEYISNTLVKCSIKPDKSRQSYIMDLIKKMPNVLQESEEGRGHPMMLMYDSSKDIMTEELKHEKKGEGVVDELTGTRVEMGKKFSTMG